MIQYKLTQNGKDYTVRYTGAYNEGDDPNNYIFDQNHADYLYKNGFIQDYADYCDQYYFTDVEKQQQYSASINRVREQSDLQEYYKNKIQDKRDYEEYMFWENYNKEYGFDNYRNKRDSEGNLIWNTEDKFNEANPTQAVVENLLSRLGGTDATKLSFTFDKKKKGIWFFGRDWTKKDEDDFGGKEGLLQKLGMNEEDLRAKGFNVVTDDEGKTTVTFDKTNPLAFKFINAIPRRDRVENMAQMKAYDKDGNELKNAGINSKDRTNSWMPGFTDEILSWTGKGATGQEINVGYNAYMGSNANPGNYEDYRLIRSMQNVISRAEDDYKRIKLNNELQTQLNSSIEFEYVDDSIRELDARYSRGELTDSQYETEYKFREAQAKKALKSVVNTEGNKFYGTGFAGKYKNDKKDRENSEALDEMTDKQIAAFQKAIANASENDITLRSMVVDGQYGLKVIIDDTKPDGKGKSTLSGGDYKLGGRGKIEVWIPGFCTQDIQAEVDRDTNIQAQLKMQTLKMNPGYSHKLDDGREIVAGNQGYYIKTKTGNEEISEPEVKRLIETSYAKRQMHNLKYKYINENGDLNQNAYINEAKKASIFMAKNLYPQTHYVDMEGQTIDPFNSFEGEGNDINYNNYSQDVAQMIRLQNELLNDLLLDAKRFIKE